MDDERIGTLMLEAVRTLEAPTEKIVDGGIARGRRRLRLLRIGEGITAIGVLVGLAGAVIALLPDGAGSQTASPPASAGPGPVTPRTVTVTPQALLRTALDTLPRPGATSHYAGNSSDGFVAARFVYDDGHGAALVSVALDYPPAGGGLGAACDISVCTTRSDGSTLAVYQGNGHPGDPSFPGKDWQVSLLRTDHVLVSITEWNSAEEKSASLTRNRPPFTVAELTNWVASPNWQVRVSAHDAKATSGLFTPVDENAPTVQPNAHLRQTCVEIAIQAKRRGIGSRELTALHQEATRRHC